MDSPKQRAVFLLIFAFAVFMVGYLTTEADEPCKSAEALSHLANVKKNQPRIAENRDARNRVASAFTSESEINPEDVEGYNAFVRNKAWNASENEALAKLGCRIDWETLELVPTTHAPEKLVNVSYTPSTVTADHREMLSGPCNGDEKCICIVNAVAKHDSSWSTAGVGKKVNNPCNLRPPATWEPSVPFSIYHAKGNGVFARFDSVKDGATACVELYQRFYQDLTADQLVSRWTDGGGDKHYRSAVANCF